MQVSWNFPKQGQKPMHSLHKRVSIVQKSQETVNCLILLQSKYIYNELDVAISEASWAHIMHT